MKRKFRKGQLCPRCGKGKLEKNKQCKNKKHAGLNELICNTCWFANF